MSKLKFKEMVDNAGDKSVKPLFEVTAIGDYGERKGKRVNAGIILFSNTSNSYYFIADKLGYGEQFLMEIVQKLHELNQTNATTGSKKGS